MSTDTLLMLLICGFVLFVVVIAGVPMYFSDELERWGKERLQPWLNKHSLSKKR